MVKPSHIQLHVDEDVNKILKKSCNLKGLAYIGIFEEMFKDVKLGLMYYFTNVM